jgi:hypothetical protein
MWEWVSAARNNEKQLFQYTLHFSDAAALHCPSAARCRPRWVRHAWANKSNTMLSIVRRSLRTSPPALQVRFSARHEPPSQ